MPLPQKNAYYTYADYLSWDKTECIELLDGSPVMMAPPSRVHQEISGEIFRQIANYLDGKKCKIYSAPFAVRLFEQENSSQNDIDTVVEPDITVICDPDKLDDQGCKGAPDLIIEILSPSTARHDRLIKFGKYQQAGVNEYWIVSPDEQTVQVYLHNGSIFNPYEVYNKTDIAKISVLEGCFVELSKVF